MIKNETLIRSNAITANVMQISEGTNSVGIVRWIWAFAYVLLSAALLSE